MVVFMLLGAATFALSLRISNSCFSLFMLTLLSFVCSFLSFQFLGEEEEPTTLTTLELRTYRCQHIAANYVYVIQMLPIRNYCGEDALIADLGGNGSVITYISFFTSKQF